MASHLPDGGTLGCRPRWAVGAHGKRWVCCRQCSGGKKFGRCEVWVDRRVRWDPEPTTELLLFVGSSGRCPVGVRPAQEEAGGVCDVRVSGGARK